MRIIILEADSETRSAARASLENVGFEVEEAGSPLEFYRGMAAAGYDIALIDADLPGGAGLEILSWLSNKDNIGIVALSERNEAPDRITSYRNGADLHLVKPVDGEELVQGVLNLLRRLMSDKGRPFAPSLWWFFDPVHWRLQAPNGRWVKLSAVETRFLKCLLIHLGGVVSRAELRNEMGYAHDRAGDKNLDAVVRRLRRKIESVADSPAPIQTVHGQGYLFSAQVRLERRRTPTQ
jgi:DNA-binding response OmpR family regulator